jgi:hypothetical protein
MIRGSHNWFAHSAKRISDYQEVAQLVGFSLDPESEDEVDNDGIMEDKTPRRLISPSETRWLVLADCIERVLGQYDALAAFFNVAYQKEKCWEAGSLHNMFKDEKNRHYLQFMYSTLKELQRLTNLFQGNNPNNIKIFGELQTYFIALATQILKPAIIREKSLEELCQLNVDSNFCMLPVDSIDLGNRFLEQLQRSRLPRVEKE